MRVGQVVIVILFVVDGEAQSRGLVVGREFCATGAGGMRRRGRRTGALTAVN